MATEIAVNQYQALVPRLTLMGDPQEGLYTPTADQRYRLGMRYEDDDNNVFYYAQAGAVALVAGNVIQQAILAGAKTTAQTNLAVATSSAIGDKFGYATILTTAQAADLYVDGYYCIEAGTAAQGRGGLYKIKAHPTLTVASHRFEFYKPCRTIITAGSATVRLITNPYKAVIQSPVTTVSGGVLGVAGVAVPISYYFWLQTWGICNPLAGAAIGIGTNILRSVAVAGSVIDDDGALVNEVTGTSLATIADTENGPIFLTIRR